MIRVHNYIQKDGVEVCKACGKVRNRDHVGPQWCSGKLPVIATRETPKEEPSRTPADLLALLREARNELNVLASYVDDPDMQWPSLGLKMTAKAHKALVGRIDLALRQAKTADFEPPEESTITVGDLLGLRRV